MAQIIIYDKKSRSEKSYPLKGETIVIGRGKTCHIHILNMKVSRNHAEIQIQGDEYYINDLNSRNGSFLNGQKIKRHKLSGNDVIFLGDEQGSDLEMVFKYAPLPPIQKEEDPIDQSELLSSESSIISLDDQNLTGDNLEQIDLKKIPKETHHITAKDYLKAIQIEKERFFLLQKISEILYSTDSLYSFMRKVLELISRVIKPDRGAIISYKTGEDSFFTEHVVFNEHCKSELIKAPFSQTLMRRTLKDRVAILTKDAKQDPRFMHGGSIMRYEIHSAMVIPLWRKEEIVGIIYLDSFSFSPYFSKYYLELLTAVAYQITVALKQAQQNARLRLESAHKEELLDSILDINKYVSLSQPKPKEYSNSHDLINDAVDSRSLLEAGLTQMIKILNVTEGAVFIREDKKKYPLYVFKGRRTMISGSFSLKIKTKDLETFMTAPEVIYLKNSDHAWQLEQFISNNQLLLDELDARIILPFIYRDRLNAIVVLSIKVDDDKYVDEDFYYLDTLSGFLSIKLAQYFYFRYLAKHLLKRKK